MIFDLAEPANELMPDVRTATRSSQWWYVTRIQLIGSKSIYSGESYL